MYAVEYIGDDGDVAVIKTMMIMMMVAMRGIPVLRSMISFA